MIIPASETLLSLPPCRERLQRKEAECIQLQQALRRSQLAAKALRRLRQQLTFLEESRNTTMIAILNQGRGSGSDAEVSLWLVLIKAVLSSGGRSGSFEGRLLLHTSVFSG